MRCETDETNNKWLSPDNINKMSTKTPKKLWNEWNNWNIYTRYSIKRTNRLQYIDDWIELE